MEQLEKLLAQEREQVHLQERLVQQWTTKWEVEQ